MKVCIIKGDSMKNRIRLEDIAKKAGVSKMSVSLALRNDPSISKETIKSIKKIADSMGYVPNKIAQSLVSGKSNTLAAIVGGNLHDDYHNQFLRGAIDYAISRGYTLTVGLTENDKKLEADIIEKFRQMMIDGYLIFHSGDSSNYKQLVEEQIPFVMYTKYFESLDCDYVICDDVRGGYLMTKHFIELGHKNIAFVYDIELEKSSEVVNRKKGYLKALEEHGMEYINEMIIPYHYNHYSFDNSNPEETNSELVECLKSGKAPTAIFVCNDVVTSAFYITMKSMGYKIPEDISIGGYEGIYLGTILDPPLTTISTPIREMGTRACERLIDKIEGKMQMNDISKVLLEPKLTIRNSTRRR